MTPESKAFIEEVRELTTNFDAYTDHFHMRILLKETLSIIESQDKEIERLKKTNLGLLRAVAVLGVENKDLRGEP